MSSAQATSRSLLAGVRRGDEEAWHRLVDLYSSHVLSWCRRDGVREEDLPDVFQEVFHTVARKIHLFRKERQSDTFRGWLRTISRHKACDLHRRRVVEPHAVGGSDLQHRLGNLPAADAEASVDESDEGERRQENVLFWQGLEQIRGAFKDSTWRAFWRTAVDGQPPQEVAEELGMSPGAVRVAKSRVLQRLRAQLGDLA